MSERIHWLLNRPYGFDNYFHLRYGDVGEKELSPCEPIQDKDLCLGIIDSSNLKAKRLLLKDRDRSSIKVTIPETGDTLDFNLPGKSAIIVFRPNLCDRKFVRDMVITLLSAKPDRNDHLHVATVRETENAGWVPYWAPLQLERKIAHVRLVAKRTIELGEDPDMSDAESLAKAFTRII